MYRMTANESREWCYESMLYYMSDIPITYEYISVWIGYEIDFAHKEGKILDSDAVIDMVDEYQEQRG